jgi:uncharacterized protein YecT (DUF1311 family)
MNMKTLLLFLSLLIFGQGFSQTQAELNKTSAQSLQRADKELNSLYQKILTNYRTDAVFLRSLKSAQKIWIQFRNAEGKMKYPDRGAGYYGSSLPMCKADYQAKLTIDRIKTLQAWIDGVEEGDTCAGSVKVRK